MGRAFSLRLLSAAIVAAAALNASAAPLGRMGATAADRSAVIRVGGNDNSRDDRPYRSERRGVVVDAPYAHVETGNPVVVDAPFAHVRVGPGRVRVIAPFVNLSVPR
jgi:hypothetical protein